jgi:hypothetical protein
MGWEITSSLVEDVNEPTVPHLPRATEVDEGVRRVHYFSING